MDNINDKTFNIKRSNVRRKENIKTQQHQPFLAKFCRTLSRYLIILSCLPPFFDRHFFPLTSNVERTWIRLSSMINSLEWVLG